MAKTDSYKTGNSEPQPDETQRKFKRGDLVAVQGKEYDVHKDELDDGNVLVETLQGDKQYLVQAKHLTLVEASENREPRCPKCNAYPLLIDYDSKPPYLAAIFCPICGWKTIEDDGRKPNSKN